MTLARSLLAASSLTRSLVRGLITASIVTPLTFNYVVDGLLGDDGNAGTEAAPWATTAPLRTAIGDADPGTITALIKATTYDATSHFDFNGVPVAAGVHAKVFMEPGCLMQGADGVDASFSNANGNAWTLEFIGLGPIKGANQAHITRWNAGSGNGLGQIDDASIIGRNLKITNCVDGWSMHGDAGSSDIYDCVISGCTKAAFTHVHTGGKARSYRCDFIGLAGATLGIGSDGSSGSALASEYHGDTFTPAANQQLLALGPNAVVSACIIGTLTTSVLLTPSTGTNLTACFIHLYIDGNQSGTFTGCYGRFGERHRNGGAGITHRNFCYKIGAAGAPVATSAMFSNFNPGANGSAKAFIDGIFTGYTIAIGSGMDATTAAQAIDGGLTVHHCCLFGNTTNFGTSLSADDGFAAAVHDNITTDPQLGPMDSTVRSAWAISATSPCIGAGENGGTIGFRA